MKMLRFTHTLTALLAISLATFAQDDVAIDEDDTEVREHPVIDGADDEFDMVVPSFVRSSRNHIIMNGADWSALRREIARVDSVPFSIVHIGDSHLQADYCTGWIRDNLQFDYGDAGRGLVTPLRMSGTNQPFDYTISSPASWSAVKLMNRNWDRTMGFTGTSVSPASRNSSITVATSEKDDFNPFSSVTIFHKGQFFVTSVKDSDGRLIPFVATPSQDYTHIALSKDVTFANINFDSAGDLTLFGANLSGDRPGLFYHVIGNNGATYDTYNRIGSVGSGISALEPDLVIISLGTNEAFGRVNASSLKTSINRLIENIRKENPMATILLVTPMECQRSTYTTVSRKSKKRKGRRRRSSTQKVKSYKTNTAIARVRNIILDYARENHIAVYDWYEVAGGEGASTKWITDGLFSHDRVHHSVKGYQLQGYMLYQALKEELSK
jgi:hypothetical protein